MQAQVKCNIQVYRCYYFLQNVIAVTKKMWEEGWLRWLIELAALSEDLRSVPRMHWEAHHYL